MALRRAGFMPGGGSPLRLRGAESGTSVERYATSVEHRRHGGSRGMIAHGQIIWQRTPGRAPDCAPDGYLYSRRSEKSFLLPRTDGCRPFPHISYVVISIWLPSGSKI